MRPAALRRDLDLHLLGRVLLLVVGMVDHPGDRAVRHAGVLEIAAHPVIRRRADRDRADALADQVLRLPHLRRVDVDEAVAEAAVQEHRDGRDVVAPVRFLHDVVAAVELVDVGGAALGDAVVDRAGAGEARDRELDALGLDLAFLERAHDLVGAGQHRELELAGRALRRSAPRFGACASTVRRPACAPCRSCGFLFASGHDRPPQMRRAGPKTRPYLMAHSRTWCPHPEQLRLFRDARFARSSG